MGNRIKTVRFLIAVPPAGRAPSGSVAVLPAPAAAVALVVVAVVVLPLVAAVLPLPVGDGLVLVGVAVVVGEPPQLPRDVVVSQPVPRAAVLAPPVPGAAVPLVPGAAEEEDVGRDARDEVDAAAADEPHLVGVVVEDHAGSPHRDLTVDQDRRRDKPPLRVVVVAAGGPEGERGREGKRDERWGSHAARPPCQGGSILPSYQIRPRGKPAV